VSPLVLGIDLGLSGARAAVVDAAGTPLGCGRARHLPSRPIDERLERDPCAWLEDAIAAARLALAESGWPAIEAIGIGALGPCPVLLDAALRPLGPAPLFSIDPRAEAIRRRLADTLGLSDEVLGPDHVVPRLLWWREEDGARLDGAAWVVDAAGFLVAQLTGRPVMDPITARDHLLPGVAPPVPLPPVLAADTIAGGLLPAPAERLGLKAGTPVTVSAYDSYVDLAGAGVAAVGDAGMLLGTTLVLGRVVADCAASDGLRCTPHLGAGWLLGGWTSAAGALLDWSDGVIGGSDEGDLAPGSGGLLVLPYFAGERAPVWDPRARGVVLGATLATSRTQLRRAMIDGVALSALDLVERIERQAGAPEIWRAGGGGARHGAWAQAMCDAVGRPVELVAHAGEAVAPALLALRALGRDAAPQIERRLMPDAARGARYAKLLPIYRTLYPALAQSMHALGRIADEQEEAA
jgi:xylulokinase